MNEMHDSKDMSAQRSCNHKAKFKYAAPANADVPPDANMQKNSS